MKIYNIKWVSQLNATIFIIGILTISISIIFIFFPKGVSNPLWITIIQLIIIWILWQFFVTGRTNCAIDKQGVEWQWIKPFFLHNNINIKLAWYEIEEIKQSTDTGYYDLVIKLKSGKKIKFYHDSLTTRDDFNQFIKELYANFSEYIKLIGSK